MNYLYIVLFLIFNDICSEVLIFTTAYNNSHLIELQIKSFKRFLKDDYKLILFNDADDPSHFQKIENECRRLNIHCENIPQDVVHKNSFKGILKYWEDAFELDKNNPLRTMIRQGQVLQYAYEKFGYMHNDILIIIDLDVFLFKLISIRELLEDNNALVAAAPNENLFFDHTPFRYTIASLWPNLIILNLKFLKNRHLINFNAGFIGSKFCDPGIFLYLYLFSQNNMRIVNQDRKTINDFCKQTDEKLKSLGLNDITIEALKSLYLDLYQINKNCVYVCIFENCFIDYARGTNWVGLPEDIMEKKNKLFEKFIDNIIL